MPLLYLAVALLSVGAGFLTATIGFGGAVFLMQFLPLFLPFLNASSLSSIIVYAGILILAWQYRGHVLCTCSAVCRRYYSQERWIRRS